MQEEQERRRESKSGDIIFSGFPLPIVKETLHLTKNYSLINHLIFILIYSHMYLLRNSHFLTFIKICTPCISRPVRRIEYGNVATAGAST